MTALQPCEMNISEINVQSDAIEYAGNMLDRHDMYDNSAPSLLEVRIDTLVVDCRFCNARR